MSDYKESVITPDERNYLKIGIASYEEMKARTIAIAQGTLRPAPADPKVWFPSKESLGRILGSTKVVEDRLESIGGPIPNCSLAHAASLMNEANKWAKQLGRNHSVVSRIYDLKRCLVRLLYDGGCVEKVTQEPTGLFIFDIFSGVRYQWHQRSNDCTWLSKDEYESISQSYEPKVHKLTSDPRKVILETERAVLTLILQNLKK